MTPTQIEEAHALLKQLDHVRTTLDLLSKSIKAKLVLKLDFLGTNQPDRDQHLPFSNEEIRGLLVSKREDLLERIRQLGVNLNDSIGPPAIDL